MTKQTKGKYPAPFKILEAAKAGLEGGHTSGSKVGDLLLIRHLYYAGAEGGDHSKRYKYLFDAIRSLMLY